MQHTFMCRFTRFVLFTLLGKHVKFHKITELKIGFCSSFVILSKVKLGRGERERERNEQLTGGKEQKIILTFL